MESTDKRPEVGQESLAPGQPGAALDLLRRLQLPEEVTTQQAAEILACCKHTVIAYLEQGLLEWRNLGVPSSPRPVYRITLRSVLELRLGYQRGSPHLLPPPQPTNKRRQAAAQSTYQPKHLHRKTSRRSSDPGASAQKP